MTSNNRMKVDPGDAGEALELAKSLLFRFTRAGGARTVPRQQTAIADPHCFAAIATELAAKGMKSADNLAFWARRAESRGKFAVVPNPAAGDDAFMLMVDRQAIAELVAQQALFDQVHADAALVQRLKSQA